MRGILVAGAASLALALAGVGHADPGGKGNGGGNAGGNGKHGGNAAAGPASGGPGNGKANNGGGNGGGGNKAPQKSADRGPDRGPAQQGPSRDRGAAPGKSVQQQGSERRAMAGPPKGSDKRGNENGNPGNGNGNGRFAGSRDDRGNARPARPLPAGVSRQSFREPGGRTVFVPVSDRVRVVTDRGGFDWDRYDVRRQVGTGCPPGLAKKYNGCTPPGLARAPSYAWQQPQWYYPSWRDAGYRWSDGYLLRVSPTNSVLGFVPLLGGALVPGAIWPDSYAPVALPDYYGRYYDTGPDYRYYDNVLYRLDPGNSAISSIAALLTGDSFGVGQPLPPAYDVYNVPYEWRDQYYDTPDAMYRYSDGMIYQVDPTTRLIQAAIELLA